MAGNLRVARNAIYLYARTIVNTIVGIFTVQIMLEALGVDDYGLQAVAGSGTAIFGFLVQVMGTSTSRFITFELGRGDVKRTHETFCTSMIVFIGLGIFMAVAAETSGMWVLHHKLQVPEGRMHAAEYLIHISAVSAIIFMPQAPYGAVMTAHEKFNVSAYVSLFGTFARLGILLLVRESGFDHLILYTTLMFVLSVCTTIFMRIYCIRHFPEARFRLSFNRELFRPMLTFSMWEIFGSISRTLKGTFYPMVVNIFHGVRLNAAIGIGSTLSGAVTGMAITVIGAFRPAIVKLFAANDIEDMKSSVRTSTQISMILYGIFATPLLAQLDFVMEAWLKQIPPLARDLCFLQLVLNSVMMIYFVPAESLKSMGRNKGVNLMQITEGILCTGFLTLVLFLGFDPFWACMINELGVVFCAAVTIVLVAHRLGMDFALDLVRNALAKVLVADVAIFCLLHLVTKALGPSFVSLIVVCALSVILFSIAALTWIFEPRQRTALRIYIRSRIPILRPA